MKRKLILSDVHGKSPSDLESLLKEKDALMVRGDIIDASIKAHFSHCYQDEYEDGCKYGLDDKECPAFKKIQIKEKMKTTFGNKGE